MRSVVGVIRTSQWCIEPVPACSKQRGFGPGGADVKVYVQAPLGASYNTWPAIYNNMQNIDFCQANFSHVKTRMKCIEVLTDGPLLP
jgi:hypothetical protein